MADGQLVGVEEPFVVGGEKMMFPGDDSMGASGWNIYNCRCRIVNSYDAHLEAERHMMRVRDPETGRNVVVEKEIYAQWAARKGAENKTVWDVYMKKGKNLSSDRRQFEEYRTLLGKKVPSSLAAFQKLKYNDPEKWKALKTEKKQTIFVNDAPCETTEKKYGKFFLFPGAKHSNDFFHVGYTSDDVLKLRYDMARQFDMSKAVDVETRPDGKEAFNIYMELGTEKKRSFITGWIKDTPDSKPRIITSFRKDEPDD